MYTNFVRRCSVLRFQSTAYECINCIQWSWVLSHTYTIYCRVTAYRFHVTAWDMQGISHSHRRSLVQVQSRLLWPPYGIGQAIIFLSCGFFFLSIFLLFSSPILSRRILDIYHTSTHGVVLVRMYDAGLKPAVRGSLKIQDAKYRQKLAICPPSHKVVGLYLRN